MSEKQAKAARQAAAEENVDFVITISVMKDGGFAMDVPKGASMVTTIDVLMRAQYKIYGTFIEALQKQQVAKRLVQPVSGLSEGLLRREPS